jgi:hypothetical protein
MGRETVGKVTFLGHEGKEYNNRRRDLSEKCEFWRRIVFNVVQESNESSCSEKRL